MMIEKHVYLVRHGESNANAKGIDLGRDSELTDIGDQQGLAVARRLSRVTNIEVIVTSPFRRALQTAEIINKHTGLQVEYCDLFIQRRRPSCVEGKKHTEPEVKQVMIEIFNGYLKPRHRHSDEENLDEIRSRAIEALNFLRDHKATRICVITHGMMLRAIFCAVLNGMDFTGDDFQKSIKYLEPDNTGITYIKYGEPNVLTPNNQFEWRLITWNDLGHL